MRCCAETRDSENLHTQDPKSFQKQVTYKGSGISITGNLLDGNAGSCETIRQHLEKPKRKILFPLNESSVKVNEEHFQMCKT
jgi:hypothetical protein